MIHCKNYIPTILWLSFIGYITICLLLSTDEFHISQIYKIIIISLLTLFILLMLLFFLRTSNFKLQTLICIRPSTSCNICNANIRWSWMCNPQPYFYQISDQSVICIHCRYSPNGAFRRNEVSTPTTIITYELPDGQLLSSFPDPDSINNKYSQEVCPICIHPDHHPSDCLVLHCGHIIHISCIKYNMMKCPICSTMCMSV